MLFGQILSGISAALLADGVSASTVLEERQTNTTVACTSHLLVDDFSSWANSTNLLNGSTGDDSTMNTTSADGGILTFTPKNIDVSYLYEQFDCMDTTALGYDGVSFTTKGPEAASVSIELQTKTNCSAEEYQSFYYTVNGLSGALETINIPLSSWTGANLTRVVGVVYYSFSAGQTGTDKVWQLDNIQLLCSRVTAPADPTAVPTTANGHEVASRSADAAACESVLIDDWASQSRLTFLYYNAMLMPSSDDGTMSSIVVKNNRVTLTPTATDSYFYTQLGCFDAQPYGGIALRITAPAGSQFDVQLSSTKGDCGGDATTDSIVTTKQLGWTFDGTEKLYSIPFSKYSGLDWSKFTMVFLTNLAKPVTLGPMGLYCGSTPVEYVVPAPVEPAEPTATVAAPPSQATNLVIDKFANAETNALGEWHGADEGITLTFKGNTMTLQTNDSDLTWNTQVADICKDMTAFDGSYLHIAYNGSNKFTVAMQQHNEQCNNDIMPYPETWDSLEAARYGTATDIYIPMTHFNINRTRAIGFALKGFYTTEPTVFSKIEIVNQIPAAVKIPEKLPSGTFVLACKRPNSFAFAIDDGDPALAQQVMKTIEDENITVTFFTVGAPLLDPTTNLSAIYNEMAAKGHQIALHSYTHPPLEGLPDEAAIDWEYSNDLRAVAQTFNGLQPKYFRPPFGTEGARMRQRLAALVDDPYIVEWSVDVEDWIWAESATPEKQLDAFKRDVTAGGDIVVVHYLYTSTVSYLQQFIQIAKATGKQLMRVDQCMMDPNAPPL
ncbi:Uu.00g053160.m01.CDS01 [Anthostomella pinea]|uniref:Uu.00g053160.m01.CDS01 n=1 Tax=Anthostomella pinea TaxID=933095 RepID=A0AAI8VWE7_9PEZI|nr:Uu.00g053160.m01.CDS01 [Anthostomella pinea]